MATKRANGSAMRGASAIGALIALVLIGAATLAGAVYLGYRKASAPGPHQSDVVVLLAPGASVARIAHELDEAGVIRDRRLFVVAVRAKNASARLKAGEYEIPAQASMFDVIRLLVEGKSILHRFTAPEGRTTAQILRAIAADPTLVGDVTLAPKEGELLPETYAFTRGETRDRMIARMIADQKALLDALWDERATDLPYTNREQAVILASIVEKETGKADERARIAAVFVNRLRRRMRLESDPTVIYGLTEGEPLGRGLRASELAKETPYNTYVISGLPPTPIANPGRAAIEAVLNPLVTDEIFFVADGDGGHAFAATLAEHERNVAQWRRIERSQATD